MSQRISLWCTVILVIFAFFGCMAPESFMNHGSRSLLEIEKMQSMIARQIGQYENKIESLREDSEKIQRWLEEDSLRGNNTKVQRARQVLRQNDSLVGVYLGSIGQLRNKSTAMYGELSTGEDFVRITGQSPQEVADAYIGVTAVTGSNNDGDGTVGQLIGIVENADPNQRTVIAQITGPGRFFVEFTLDNRSNKKSIEFVLPRPGLYTCTFIGGQSGYGGQETRSVTKKVGSGIIYYDGSKKLAFKATLLAPY